MENITKIDLFKNKQVRKTLHNNEWWFVINDIIEVLTDSNDPSQYFKKLKERDNELAKLTDKGGVQFVPPLMLEMETVGGKQKMYCWNTEGIFRLIQSIPSPKAEPIKLWLAKVGYERIQEMADPEKSINRGRMNWQRMGRDAKCIQQRMMGQEIRNKVSILCHSREGGNPVGNSEKSESEIPAFAGMTRRGKGGRKKKNGKHF